MDVSLRRDFVRSPLRAAGDVPSGCSTGNARGAAHRFGLFVALLALFLFGVSARAQEPKVAEYEFKAAFLYKFANFVSWPTNVWAPDDGLALGILGEDPFGDALERTLDGNMVQGHKIIIRRAKEVAELKNCQLLFISATERKRLPQILESLQGTSVLTVSETDRFCEAGGMINFKLVGKNLRFEINPEAAERAKLKISSQLLKLALIIREDGKGQN
jgi:hypothetical protein